MADMKCFACGSPLTTPTPKNAVCSNKQCPSGGIFSVCGFCKEMSLSVSPQNMYCWNQNCRMYKRTRKICPHCGKAALMNVFGKEICINRACPSNLSIIEECFFCHNKAFLNYPDIPVCTKGDCAHLLQIVRECEFCHERSFVEEEEKCMNPVCRMHLVKIAMCKACGKRVKVDEPGHPDYGKCLTPGCKGEQIDMGMTLGGFEIPAGFGAQPAPSPEMTLQDIPAIPMTPTPPRGPSEETPRPGSIPPLSRQSTDSNLPRVDSVRVEVPPEKIPTRGYYEQPTAAEMPHVPKEEPKPWERASEPEKAPAPWEAPRQAEKKPPAPEPKPWERASEPPSSPAPFEAPPDKRETPFFAEEPRYGQKQEASPFAAGGPRLSQVSSAPAGEKAAKREKMLEVFEFVREHVLKSETGEFYPIYLLIGLSGAGKTTYLTVLGNILQYMNMKYYFPHQGIGIRPVRIVEIFDRKYRGAGGEQAAEFRKRLEDRVLDLVYDYSRDLFNSTIAKGLWAEPTPRHEDSTYFLVSDVTKDQKIIARLVTFETSGEDFEDAIHAITKLRSPEEASNSLQRIILELMNYAEGFIILIDPANEVNNDNIFSNLFLELRLCLEPRALNTLYRNVKEVLVSPEDELKKFETGTPDLRAVLAAQAEEREAKSRREREIIETKRLLLDKLTEYKHKIETQGVSVILDDREGFLEELDNLVMKLDPKAKKAKERVKELGFKESQIQSFYIGLINLCVQHVDKLAVYYHDAQQKKSAASDASKDPRRVEGAMRLIFERRGISPQFRQAADMSLADDRPVSKFHKLRDIAVVITKSDMYPIVYPPEDYPKFKLPSCKQSIDLIDNYLKLVGGRINYYNASAVGYSILKDIRYYPGAENTLTPINIIEPIFDMLRI